MKDIRDKAEAMAAYARQAKDIELIRMATEIKVRAERRAGELLREMAETGQRRVLALDWVRVLAIGVVFLFHSIRAFTEEGWQVHNAVSYEGLDIVTGIISTWMMPVIFLMRWRRDTRILYGIPPTESRPGFLTMRLSAR